MCASYKVITPDRYLRLVKLEARVAVFFGKTHLITSNACHYLFEGDRDPVVYMPLTHELQAKLHPSKTQYSCRWKGNARYFHYQLGDDEWIEDASWSYPQAPVELAPLRTLVAFDTARVTQHIEHANRSE